jgi:chromosome segregation ATPase
MNPQITRLLTDIEQECTRVENSFCQQRSAYDSLQQELGKLKKESWEQKRKITVLEQNARESTQTDAQIRKLTYKLENTRKELLQILSIIGRISESLSP